MTIGVGGVTLVSGHVPNGAFGSASRATLRATVPPASVAPSTYFSGSDGSGTITLNLQQVNGSNVPVQTFSFVVLSTSRALIAELDLSSNTGTPNSASGTLELQDATAAATTPTGAYAFVSSGTDAGSPNGPSPGFPVPTAIGGVFNIDNNPSAGSRRALTT